MKPVLIVLLLPFFVSAKVYKCEVDGVVTYSQLPCSEDAEVTAYATEPPQSSLPAAEAKQANSASATIDRLSESIKKRDMQIAINRLKSDKTNKQAERDGKLAELKNSKQLSANNLAGAVRQESLSEEMAAVASQYDTDIRSIDVEIDRLTEQLNSF